MKVAILYICTGKYKVFWKEFYESFEENFLPHTKKYYYVFSDSFKLQYAEKENVCIIPQQHLKWPNNTLQRFSFFIKEESRWADCDYTLFVNSNFLCVDIVTEEEFLPVEEDILVAEHAGYHGQNPLELPYEENPKSKAYVNKSDGKYYVMGGINGGKTSAYMKMLYELKANVDYDAKNGIVAKCHDESHLNRYIIGRRDVKVLPPSYGYPEGWDLPYKAKMLIRDKSKYFDVEAFKAGGIVGRINLYLRRLKSKLAIRIRIRKLINFFRRGD